MKLKQIVMASALALVAAIPTQSMAVEKGENSIGFYGMISSSGDNNSYIAGVQAGRFLTEHLELNVDMTINYNESPNTEQLAMRVGAAADYYFLTKSSWLPYAGGGINATESYTANYGCSYYVIGTTLYQSCGWSDNTNSYGEVFAEGGVRKPLSETASMDLKLRYIKPFDNTYDDTTMFMIGLRVKL